MLFVFLLEFISAFMISRFRHLFRLCFFLIISLFLLSVSILSVRFWFNLLALVWHAIKFKYDAVPTYYAWYGWWWFVWFCSKICFGFDSSSIMQFDHLRVMAQRFGSCLARNCNVVMYLQCFLNNEDININFVEVSNLVNIKTFQKYRLNLALKSTSA